MAKKHISERRSDHSPAAAEEVSGNQDLIRQIFLYLPARSLFRFKSVSKQWLSLISDPQFTGDHVRRTNPSSKVPSGIYLYNPLTKSRQIEAVSLNETPNQPSRVRVPNLFFLVGVAPGAKIKIKQSCNGLLLCSLTSQLSDSEVKIDYCVCNPSTRTYTLLPQPCLISRQKIIIYGLAYDPSESRHYKVICIKSRFVFYFDGPCQIDIYSSETGIWRASSCQFEAWFGIQFGNGFYWNGGVQWISTGISKYYFVEFNLNEESLEVTRMPPFPQTNYNHKLRYFGECNGHLHLIYVRTPCAKLFRVLEKDRETLKWCVKYIVNINRLLSAFPEIVQEAGPLAKLYGEVEYAFSVLSVFKGEKEEDSALVLTIPGKVISYNFHHKTTKVLWELPSKEVDTSNHYYNNGFHYIETLYLV